jgi:hypothetical protein
MLKLILWLLCLLGSLLLLNDRKCIFWLVGLSLSKTLCSFILSLVLLLLVVHCIYSLRHAIISNRLLYCVHSSDAEGFLVLTTVVECFLVVVIDDMHTKALIWKPVSIISTVLRHLINLQNFSLRLDRLLSVQAL